MKSIITFALILYIVLLMCDASPQYSYRYRREDTHVPPPSLDNVDYDSVENEPSQSTEDITVTTEFNTDRPEQETVGTEAHNELITTEDPFNNETTTTTTELSIDTTTSKHDSIIKGCPTGQSSYSKHDLVLILNFFSDVQFNIMSNISNAYHDTAIKARDELIKEFNEIKTKFEDRPQHLIHVLDDMVKTRKTKIDPLVEIANATLQEFPTVEDAFNKLSEKTAKMMENLNKFKKICDLNNCNPLSLRSSFPFKSAHSIFSSKPKVEENMCSTIENVRSTINDQLSSFEKEETEKLKKYITNNEDLIDEAISVLKVRLREAAVSQFGTTMYEILNVYDDHIHFMQSLIDFNGRSHTNVLKKKNMNIDYKLLDLDSYIQQFREHCLSCGIAKRRRRSASDETPKDDKTVPDKSNLTLLDKLINEKIVSIKKVVQANIENIFKDLNDTVNDNDLVEKTVALLQPVQEGISNRTETERQVLETLMKSAPKETLEHAQDVQLKATDLIDTINESIDFLKKLKMS